MAGRSKKSAWLSLLESMQHFCPTFADRMCDEPYEGRPHASEKEARCLAAWGGGRKKRAVCNIERERHIPMQRGRERVRERERERVRESVCVSK